jgi:hypothetical protein
MEQTLEIVKNPADTIEKVAAPVVELPLELLGQVGGGIVGMFL